MPSSAIEQRLRALEQEVAHLKGRLDGPLPTERWWETVSGAFAGVEAYQEAMELGRQWRERENAKSMKPRTKRARRNVRS